MLGKVDPADNQLIQLLARLGRVGLRAEVIPSKSQEAISPDYQSSCIISLMKPLRFVGSSLDDLSDFPAETRRQAGFELDAIQQGLDPSDWKPMPDIGPGVREIRIHVLGEWRVLYVAKFGDAVYVLMRFGRRPKRRGVRMSNSHDRGTVRSRNDQ